MTNQATQNRMVPRTQVRTKNSPVFDSEGKPVKLDEESSYAEVKKGMDSLGKSFHDLQTELKKARKEGTEGNAVTEEKLKKLEDSVSGIEAMKAKLDQLEAVAKKKITTVEGGVAKTIKIGDRVIDLPDDIDEMRSKFLGWMMGESGNTKGSEDKGDRDLRAYMAKAMSVDSHPDGGLLVVPDMSGRVVNRIFDTSPIRQYANVRLISGTDRLEGLRSRDRGATGWVKESGSRQKTKTPKFEEYEIPLHEIYTMPAVTQKLMNTGNSRNIGSVESLVEADMAREFMLAENEAMIIGDGIAKPFGILAHAATANPSYEPITVLDSGLAGDVTFSKITELLYDLQSAFHSRSIFFANRPTWGLIRRKEDADGRPLWQPSLQVGQPSTLLGLPSIEFDDMPSPAAGSLSLGVGDLADGYQIVDSSDITMLRDPYTEKGFVLFYSTKWVGGDVINADAIRLMRFQ